MVIITLMLMSLIEVSIVGNDGDIQHNDGALAIQDQVWSTDACGLRDTRLSTYPPPQPTCPSCHKFYNLIVPGNAGCMRPRTHLQDVPHRFCPKTAIAST